MGRTIIVILLLTCCGTASGKILVPGRIPYKYVVPGDLSLGVFQNVFGSDDSGKGCDDAIVNMYALHCCEGALYALQEINKLEHLLPNMTLGMVCMDTCSNPITTLGQAVYMVEDHNSTNQRKTPGVKMVPEHHKVVGVVGPGMSRISVVISSFFEVFEIPIVGPFESSDQLSDKSSFGYFSRLVPPDMFQAEVFVDIIKYFNWTYVGLIYSEGSYGEHGARRIHSLVKGTDICLAYSHAIPVDQEPEEAEKVIKLLETHHQATAVVWFVDFDILDRLFTVLEPIASSWEHIFLMSDSAVVLEHTYQNLLDGSLMTSFVTPPIPGYKEHFDNAFSLRNQTNPDLNYWVQGAYKVTYNCNFSANGNKSCWNYNPDSGWFDGYSWVATNYYEATYVFANVLHDMISSRCPSADPDALDKCIPGPEMLDRIRALQMDGVTGQVMFDANGDRLPKYHIIHCYHDELNRLVKTDVGTWDKLAGSLIMHTERLSWAKQKPSEGLSSTEATISVPHSFCSSECEPKQYKIQLTPECCWDCRWCRSNEILIKNKSSCIACPSYTWPDDETATVCIAISPTYIQWTEPIALSLMVFALTGTLTSLSFVVISWQNRNTRLIKATNKEQSFLILISCTLAFLITFFFISKPSKVICFFREVGFHIVVNLLYTPLLVKTIRVHIIFSSGKKGVKAPRMVSVRSQRLLTLLMILLQIFILIAVKIYNPSNTELVMPVSTEPYVELACNRKMIPFLLPLTYNVVSIISCAIFGYSARKLPDNYNESGFIFVSVATTLFAWVVLLPTFFTAGSSANQAAILALCLMLNAFITVGCLFAPKMYALFCVDESAIKFSTMNPTNAISVTHTETTT